MLAEGEENQAKRPRVSHDGEEEEEVIELEESEDGNPEEDVQLENQLRDAQADLDKIHEEMLSRLREVEQDFERRKTPFYKARGEVIKSIPGFWLHCFLQHRDVKGVIGELDQQILRSLTEIAVEPLPGSQDGYRLSFSFGADNEWFTDPVLTKEVSFISDEGNGSQICSTSGSKPKWKKEPPAGDAEGSIEGAPFLSWLLTELILGPGLVDTLADIIKDQLYVNPLEYLEAGNESENQDLDDAVEDDLENAADRAFEDPIEQEPPYAGADSEDEEVDEEPEDDDQDDDNGLAGEGSEGAEEAEAGKAEEDEELVWEGSGDDEGGVDNDGQHWLLHEEDSQLVSGPE